MAPGEGGSGAGPRGATVPALRRQAPVIKCAPTPLSPPPNSPPSGSPVAAASQRCAPPGRRWELARLRGRRSGGAEVRWGWAGRYSADGAPRAAPPPRPPRGGAAADGRRPTHPPTTPRATTT